MPAGRPDSEYRGFTWRSRKKSVKNRKNNPGVPNDSGQATAPAPLFFGEIPATEPTSTEFLLSRGRKRSCSGAVTDVDRRFMIPAVQAATSSGASLVENPAEKSGSIFSRLRKLSARHKDNNSESIAVPVAAEYSQPSVGNPAEAPRGEGAFSRLRKLSARVRKNNSSQSITVQAATEYSRPPVDNVAKTLGGESGGRDARGSDQFSESRTAVDSSAEPEDDLQPGLASGRSVVNGAGLKGKARVYEDMTPPDNRLSTPSLASQIHTSTSPSSPFHDAEADIVELYFADTRALSDPDAFRALQQQQRGRPNPDAGPSTGGGMFLSLRNRTKSILKKPDSQFGTMQAAMQSTPALGRPKKVSFSLPSFATRKRTSSTGAADQPSNYVQPVIKSPPPPAGKTTKESSGIVDYLRNRKRSITKGVPPGQKPSSGSGKMPTPFSEPLPSLNTPAEDPPSPPGDSLRAERPSASPQKPKTGTDNNMTSGPSGSLGTSPSTPNPPIRRKKSFHLPRLRPRTISAKAVESEQSVPSTSPRPLNPHAQEFIPQMTIVKKAEDGPLTVSESETTLATSPTSSSSVGSSTFDNVISPRAEDLSSAATTQNLGPRAGPVPEAASPAPSPTDTLVAKSYSDLYVPPHRRRKSAESGIFLKSTIPFPSSTEDTGPANGIGLTNEPGPANELGPTNDLGPANETGTVKETRPDDGTGLDDEVSGNETALANQPGTTESEEFTLKTDSKYSIYKNLLNVLWTEAKSQLDTRIQQEIINCFESTSDNIPDSAPQLSALVSALGSQRHLLEIASKLSLAEDIKTREALSKDRRHIRECLNFCQSVILERAGDFHCILDLVQDVLDSTPASNGIGDTKLHRLIVKLSSACGNFPSSLFLRGVEARAQFPFAAGGFGDIYKAVYQSKPVALKQLRFYEEHTDEERQRIREKFYQEALLWKNLKHPFVIPFIGLYSSENDPNNDNASQSHHLSMSMVCPWMSNGTVLRYLKHCPAARVDIFLLEIAQGLRYLHSQCVVHGDLRGANILVDDEGNARLADFGLASYANATVKSSARAGSLRWMAPELLDPGCLTFRRTFATDVYAFACVCYELYKGEYPFPDIPVDTAVMFEVIAGRRPKRTSIPPQIWELIQACWCDDPGKRLTAPSIVEKLEIIQKINAERLSNGSSLSPTEPPGIYKPPRSLGLSQNGNWTSSLGRTPSLLVNVLPSKATENLRRRSSGHFDLFSGPSHTPGLDHSQISWRQPARAISMFLKKAKGDVTASVVRTDPGGSRAASQGPIRQRFLSLLPQPTRWT